MSQFAYENGLNREGLAHFAFGDITEVVENHKATDPGILVLLSGGKDSLLTAEKVRESGVNFKVCYITAQQNYPAILDEFGNPIVIRREIDVEGLKQVVDGAGELFTCGDERELAQIVNLLLNDEDMYKEMQQKCLSRAKLYDIHATVEAYLKIYKEVSV
jgi:predicted PP-loop superfamily ATPase